ncbi:hypothetical protein [Gordonia aichiensis]
MQCLDRGGVDHLDRALGEGVAGADVDAVVVQFADQPAAQANRGRLRPLLDEHELTALRRDDHGQRTGDQRAVGGVGDYERAAVVGPRTGLATVRHPAIFSPHPANGAGQL